MLPLPFLMNLPLQSHELFDIDIVGADKEFYNEVKTTPSLTPEQTKYSHCIGRCAGAVKKI
jgi:hypothetical protein